MDGIRYGSVLPLIPALCFAPKAACSCFSTFSIFSWSLLVAGLAVSVDMMLNCSVRNSTLDTRFSSWVVLVSQACWVLAVKVSYGWDGVDRVALWVDASARLALSSVLVILSTRSSMIFSR
jgi:hypothetical protein